MARIFGARLGVGRAEREQQPAAGLEPRGPKGGRRRHGEIHIDAVDRLAGRAGAVARGDGDLGPGFEIFARAFRQVGIELIGADAAGRPGELGQHGGVIAGAGADMRNVLAGRDGEVVQHPNVQRRAAIVDAAAGLQRDQHVLIDGDGIVAWQRRHRRAPHELPGLASEEILAADLGEGRRDGLVLQIGRGQQLPRIGAPHHRQLGLGECGVRHGLLLRERRYRPAAACARRQAGHRQVAAASAGIGSR